MHYNINIKPELQKQGLLTLTAEADSSKLERKAWVRNGLYLSGPVASKLHASHSVGETSEIEEMTESDILLGFPSEIPPLK